MCLVSVFSLSLSLHPVTKRAKMQHNLVPYKGLKVKAEMENMNLYEH